jgi:phosphatidylethanolamine/phosphatidyl-N-methylethanolamine N-methyltransferase
MSRDAARPPALDEKAVRAAYRAWAPVYDYSFGVVAGPGRRLAVSKLNGLEGRILEIGVGTGLSLPRYKPSLDVTGIDLSEDMLEKASARIRRLGLKRVTLTVMDASRLAFPGESFDAAAAMYVMTVVPDPAAVMAEMLRVLRPGGTAICINHFSREHGVRAAAERGLARYSCQLGWHPVFPLKTVTGAPGFRVAELIDLPPFGLFTLLSLVKVA